MLSIWEELEQKIRASYPYFYLVSHEENRVAANLNLAAKKLKLPLVNWSAYRGFSPALSGLAEDPLEAILEHNGGGLFLLRDFHVRLNDPITIRRFKDQREALIRDKKTVLICAPLNVLPVELEKQFTVFNVPLPVVRELQALLSQMCGQHHVELDKPILERFARAASGLTAEEAMLIFSRLLLEPERLAEGDATVIIEEKRRLVEGEGLLQYYDRQVTLSDIGGLYALKDWLHERDAAFDERAREFGLPEPKGLLLLGVQGCGKSLTAKAVASHWQLPLVQLDLGAAFASSRSPEEAIRNATRTLEALSPVVVWIDEIEKAFAGSKGGGDVSIQRIFGHFITWLQEKQRPVFVVATANGIESLPPELLRKGRFDEIFFVDLPDERERTEILRLHMNKRKLNPDDFPVADLVKQARNFTGAEIEQVVVDALYRAFAEKRAVTAEDLQAITAMIMPIYNTYEEDIKRLRDWARDRARRASFDTSLVDLFQKEEA